jgi:hypothetical protein
MHVPERVGWKAAKEEETECADRSKNVVPNGKTNREGNGGSFRAPQQWEAPVSWRVSAASRAAVVGNAERSRHAFIFASNRA